MGIFGNVELNSPAYNNTESNYVHAWDSAIANGMNSTRATYDYLSHLNSSINVSYSQYSNVIGDSHNVTINYERSAALWELTNTSVPAPTAYFSTLYMAQSGLTGDFTYKGEGTIQIVCMNMNKTVLGIETTDLPNSTAYIEHPLTLLNGTQYFNMVLNGNLSLFRVFVQDPSYPDQSSVPVEFQENDPANYGIGLGHGSVANGSLLNRRSPSTIVDGISL